MRFMSYLARTVSMHTHLPTVLLLVVLASATRARAATDEAVGRVDLPGESANTARRLAAADKLAEQKHPAEAVEEYERILTETGDDLVALSPRHCVQVRWLCHLRLAALAPADLRLYRQRADAKAKKWFEEGKTARDARLLRRVVDEAFCSRYGDKALDLLGDLAFERGRFDEAERWWRLLTPPAYQAARPKPNDKKAPPTIDDLVFPDPQVDGARVRAKQLLARIFRGDGESTRLQEDLKTFRALHSKAEGRFAGRTGTFADILQTVLQQQDKPRAADGPSSWPTFAGDPSRTFAASDPVRRFQRLCARPPRWRFDLQQHKRIDKAERKLPARVLSIPALNRILAFHPVIMGEQVLVADACFVTAYNLRTGDASVWYDASELDGLGKLVKLKLPAPADLRYSLTLADDCVFARLGVQEITADRDPRANLSLLVCLRLRPGEKEERLRWQTAPDEPKAVAVFEGAPVVRDGRVYIAATRVEKGQTITAIHCYPVHTEDTPQPLWRKDICSTQELGPKARRYRHHLLTLAGPRVVYCSHSGAIVALDADTGRRAWAVRYPTRGNAALLSDTADGGGAPRDLIPCIYAAGRIYAAPADSSSLLCLDVDTGRTLWEKGSTEVVHLLGIARQRLIFTTLKGIQALDATSGDKPPGSTRKQIKGWAMPDTGELAPLGRGFIADGLVFWPTARGLHVLDVEDGQQVAEFVPGVLPTERAKKLVGNLVYANGCLAVAGPRELQLYVADAHLREERRRQAEEHPGSSSAHYQLALAEADAGMHDRALASFRHAQRRAGEESLRASARAGQHEVLLEQARRAMAANQWDGAAACLRRAAASEFATADRLRALERQASLWVEAGQPARAVAVWQIILADDALCRARMDDAAGNPHCAATLATTQIDALIRDHGHQVYAAVEKQARERLTSATDEHLTETLQQLAAQFPNAAVTGSALLELARSNEKDGRFGAAANDYRALLRLRDTDEDRALALARLARVYERERCWRAAKTTWKQLADLSGDSIVPAIDSDHSVRAVVAREMKKPPYAVLQKASTPNATPPLLRLWEAPLECAERLLVLEGPQATGISEEVVFFGKRGETGGRLTCRAAATGKDRWACPLSFAPTWIGCHADTVIAGGEGGICCMRLADGQTNWDFPATVPVSAFRLASGRLFFMEGGRRLFAVDVETGRVLWNRWAPAARLGLPPPSGRFFTGYHAGEERLLVQTAGGRRWLLDAQTGRTLDDAETSGVPWTQPPLVLDGRRACVVMDARHVVQLDLATCKESWVHESRRTASLTGEPPQLLGNGESLLLITPRNYGTSLQCLDPRTGLPQWDTERLLTTDALAADQVSCDGTALYFVAGNVLHARSLADGKSLWARPLGGPAARWRTLATPDAVIAYPVNTRKVHIRIGSLLESVELTAVDSSVPVELCDPKSGQLVQRLNLASPGRRKTLGIEALLRTGDNQPVVLLTGRGLIMSAAGNVVRFK
jgi:outer membrane protein assembly factor BamB